MENSQIIEIEDNFCEGYKLLNSLYPDIPINAEFFSVFKLIDAFMREFTSSEVENFEANVRSILHWINTNLKTNRIHQDDIISYTFGKHGQWYFCGNEECLLDWVKEYRPFGTDPEKVYTLADLIHYISTNYRIRPSDESEDYVDFIRYATIDSLSDVCETMLKLLGTDYEISIFKDLVYKLYNYQPYDSRKIFSLR